MYVAYAPGGGVDYSARLLASFWHTVTGGAMVVENKPGANGLVMANFMASSAKRDGSELGATSTRTGLLGPWVMQDPAVQFDAIKFNYIGSVANEAGSALAIGASKPYNSIADLQQAKGLKFGVSSKTGGTAVDTAVLIKLLGLDARIVVGYPGTAELSLAAGRGEIDGYVTGELTIKAESDKGYLKGALVMIDRERSTLYKDAPAITEVVKLSPDDELLLDTSLLLKARALFFTPPEVSQDKVNFLRAAFDKIVADSGFIAPMTRYYGVYAPPVTGVEEAKKITHLGTIPKSQFDAVTKLIDQYAGQ